MAPPISLSALAVPLDIEPMEAKLVEELPDGDWQYEPKWDGFRCLAFKAGGEVDLKAKSGKPLARYFPEMVETLKRVKAPSFVLDGELAIVKRWRILLRCAASAHPSGGEPHQAPRGGDAGDLYPVRSLARCVRQEPDRGAADDAARGARRVLRLGEAGARAEALALHAEPRRSRALAQARRHGA